MAANAIPIFSKTPNIDGSNISGGGYMTAANTTADLTAGTIYLSFTAGSNGAFVNFIRYRPTPAGNTTATVARVWLNNGSATGTATNNILFDEISLPATTASGTGATNGFSLPMNIALKNGWRIYHTIHTASANGWAATVVGGDY